MEKISSWARRWLQLNAHFCHSVVDETIEVAISVTADVMKNNFVLLYTSEVQRCSEKLSENGSPLTKFLKVKAFFPSPLELKEASVSQNFK